MTAGFDGEGGSRLPHEFDYIGNILRIGNLDHA